MADFKKLKTGSKLSETQYYVVEQVKNNDVLLRTDLGELINVNPTYVEKCLVSADE